VSSSVGKIYLSFAVALAGCAGASATTQSQSQPVTTDRPTQIVVYPFSVDPSDITLNQSIVQRAYRSVSAANESTTQLELAHDTAQKVCLETVTALKQKGWNATCQNRGTPIAGDNVLFVDGQFTDINEGNRLRRMVIGFGAGASTLDTSVQMYQRTNQASRQVMEFTTHADSGKMPGAALMAPVGAAAGAGAAATVGVNAAAGGVKSVTSSTGFLADKTATQVVDRLTGYFAQNGWGPEAPGIY
jgi:hypothetical protein